MTALESPAAPEALKERRPATRPSLRHVRPYAGLLLPLTLALAWEYAVHAGWSDGRLLPPPSRIAATLLELARNGDLTTHVLATLARVGAGFFFGALAGIALGAASGYSSLFRTLVDPTLQGLRAIPSLAWVPLFILWFGIFEQSKIILIAIGVFFPVYLGVSSAIRSVDRKIVEVGQVFRLKGLQLVRRILLPAILPQVVTALRVGLGLGWMFVVAAEIMGASEGLGYLLVDGQQLGKPDEIVATIILFALIGKASDMILVALSHPFLHHEDSFAGGDR